MRGYSIKIAGLLVIGLFTQATSYAQDWEAGGYQSPEEQQRIREMRLLEWHAQEQSGQYVEEQSQQVQGESQNVSFNQPQRQAPEQVAPAREDLFNAANSGNVQQISKLLSQGLNVNVTNNERETALHMAVARGHFQAVMLLVRHGANVNAQTVKNWIPLHHAVRFRHPNIVNFLIQRGAYKGARTSDGLSAVDMANNNRDYRILSIMGAR